MTIRPATARADKNLSIRSHDPIARADGALIMNHRRPSIARFAFCALLAAGGVSACTSTHPTAASTSAAVQAAPPVPVDPHAIVRSAIEQWHTLTAGHTVTYTASSECIVCAAPGRWRVVERDGALLSATPLDGQDAALGSQVSTVSAVLDAALAAKGNATASVSPSNVFVTFDPDPQVSGDESDITAENIVVS